MSKPRKPLKVGHLYPVWWHTDGDYPNMATVLQILPYRGLFDQFYDAVLRLSAPRCHAGYLEMAVNLANYEYYRVPDGCTNIP